MNRKWLLLIGSVILLTLSVSASEPVRVFHSEIARLCDSTLIFPAADNATSSLALEVRASVKKPSAKPGLQGNGFAVVWSYGTTTMEAWLIPSADDFDPLTSKTSVEFILLSKFPGAPASILNRRRLTSGVASGRGFNTLGVEIAPDGAATIYGGEKEPIDIYTLPSTGHACTATGIAARGEIDVDLLVTERLPDPASGLSTTYTAESLTDYFKTNALLPPEGIWRFLDRDTDDRAVRLGGDYTIAIVADSTQTPEAPPAYSIIYMAGARVGNDDWSAGMKKGRLTTTLFQNHYNLIWIATDMTEIDTECSAQLSDDRAILTLNFPLYGSTVRFARQLSDGALPEK